MNQKRKWCNLAGMVMALLLCVSGCGNQNAAGAAGQTGGIAEAEAENQTSESGENVSGGEAALQKASDSAEEAALDQTAEPETASAKEQEPAEAAASAQEDTAEADEAADAPIAEVDVTPSEGLEFESNGDGTCTITGIGTCTDEDLVIPLESPDGDTVTLIGKYALYGLEDVQSVTLANYMYEVDENAFQYGEFTAVSIIGGSPVLNKSAFSSCEDLTSITIRDCQIQAEEYAFYACGKDAEVTLSNCTGVIGDNAFQYGDFLSLTMRGCDLQLEKSAFSSCEDFTSIVFADSVLETEEYAFYACGDSARVEMTDCDLTFDDRTFQYSSLESVTMTGSKVEMGESVFSSCEDLATVSIDCDSVILGEYAFYDCEDLLSVTIGESAAQGQEIQMDDRVFQYCKRLETVQIGDEPVEIGEYVFSECADNLEIVIAGKTYMADRLEEGL